MNRLRLWAFALLVLVAGGANLLLTTQWLAHDAVAEADRALRAAAAQLDARSQLLAGQAGALADAAARAPAVLAALVEDADGDATSAATLAVTVASRGKAAEGARSLLVGTSGPEGAVLRLAGRPVDLQDPATGLFAEPLRGVRREGYARAADTAWFVVAVPAGKGAVAVGLPVDEAWARGLRDASGVEVLLAAGQAEPVTTLSGPGLAQVALASRAAMPRPVDAGALGSVPTTLPGAPALPLLLTRLPSFRVQVVTLRGMKAGLVALAVPLARPAGPIVTYQAISAVVLLLLLLAGLFLGLLITPDIPASIPRELVVAADRIGRGDFAARVPRLAGSLGTVSQALNRAAEAAEVARAQPTPFEAPPIPPGLFGPGASPVEPDPFAAPPRPPPASLDPPRPPPPPPVEPTGTDLFAAPPLPPLSPPPFGPMGDTVSGATSLATRPEDLLPVSAAEPYPTPAVSARSLQRPVATPVPAPGPLPGEVDPELLHWREVFHEFLRVREACGEANDGLGYERFEAKLRTNRAALIAKHSCRTVRFQVYVKDGRAALKATPVR